MSLDELLDNLPPLVPPTTEAWPKPRASNHPQSLAFTPFPNSVLFSATRRPTLQEFLHPNFHASFLSSQAQRQKCESRDVIKGNGAKGTVVPSINIEHKEPKVRQPQMRKVVKGGSMVTLPAMTDTKKEFVTIAKNTEPRIQTRNLTKVDDGKHPRSEHEKVTGIKELGQNSSDLVLTKSDQHKISHNMVKISNDLVSTKSDKIKIVQNMVKKESDLVSTKSDKNKTSQLNTVKIPSDLVSTKFYKNISQNTEQREKQWIGDNILGIKAENKPTKSNSIVTAFSKHQGSESISTGDASSSKKIGNLRMTAHHIPHGPLFSAISAVRPGHSIRKPTAKPIILTSALHKEPVIYTLMSSNTGTPAKSSNRNETGIVSSVHKEVNKDSNREVESTVKRVNKVEMEISEILKVYTDEMEQTFSDLETAVELESCSKSVKCKTTRTANNDKGDMVGTICLDEEYKSASQRQELSDPKISSVHACGSQQEKDLDSDDDGQMKQDERKLTLGGNYTTNPEKELDNNYSKNTEILQTNREDCVESKSSTDLKDAGLEIDIRDETQKSNNQKPEKADGSSHSEDDAIEELVFQDSVSDDSNEDTADYGYKDNIPSVDEKGELEFESSETDGINKQSSLSKGAADLKKIADSVFQQSSPLLYVGNVSEHVNDAAESADGTRDAKANNMEEGEITSEGSDNEKEKEASGRLEDEEGILGGNEMQDKKTANLNTNNQQKKRKRKNKKTKWIRQKRQQRLNKKMKHSEEVDAPARCLRSETGNSPAATKKGKGYDAPPSAQAPPPPPPPPAPPSLFPTPPTTLLDSVSNIAVDVTIAASEKELKRKTRGGNAKAQKMRKRAKQRETNPERFRKKVVFEPPSQPICTFYLEGRCNKGEECTFRHEGTPVPIRELCRFYRKSDCRNGDNCIYMHSTFPCKYWHMNGRCGYGNDCRFSHDPLTPETKALLDKFLLEEKTTKEMYHASLQNEQSSDVSIATDVSMTTSVSIATDVTMVNDLPLLCNVVEIGNVDSEAVNTGSSEPMAFIPRMYKEI